jgi:hypothetical protein
VPLNPDGWAPIRGSEYKNFTSWEDDDAMHIRFDINGSLHCCRDRILDGVVGTGRRSKRALARSRNKAVLRA